MANLKIKTTPAANLNQVLGAHPYSDLNYSQGPLGTGVISSDITADAATQIAPGQKIVLNATNTASGTTGAQTINKPSGTVNIAAAASSVVVTNSFVTTSSIVLAVIRTNDSTAILKNVVPANGSFTIRLTANTTAETSVGFVVIN